MSDWLAGLYVNVLNLIQYMHDKYYYEAAEMALIDTDVRRTFATGIAGFSHVIDSLSAIKYAKVRTVRNEAGIVTDYEIEETYQDTVMMMIELMKLVCMFLSHSLTRLRRDTLIEILNLLHHFLLLHQM